MMKFIVLSFFLFQTLFTSLDLWALASTKTRGEWQDSRRRIGFIVLVWLIYFLIQSAGLYVIPGLGRVQELLAQWSSLELVGETHWTWRVSLMFFWSFEVVAFFDFLTHRWILHHRWFWLFHEYHHLPKVIVNGMPGISVRPYVFLITLLDYIFALYLLYWPLKNLLLPEESRAFIQYGLPLLAFWLTLILSVVHSHFLRQFPKLHYFFKWIHITSPHEHLLHHSSILNCNFGNYTTVWDRLFGSYVDPFQRPYQVEPLGLSYDQDYLGTLCMGHLKLPRSIRERFDLKDTVCIKD